AVLLITAMEFGVLPTVMLMSPVVPEAPVDVTFCTRTVAPVPSVMVSEPTVSLGGPTAGPTLRVTLLAVPPGGGPIVRAPVTLISTLIVWPLPTPMVRVGTVPGPKVIVPVPLPILMISVPLGPAVLV